MERRGKRGNDATIAGAASLFPSPGSNPTLSDLGLCVWWVFFYGASRGEKKNNFSSCFLPPPPSSAFSLPLYFSLSSPSSGRETEEQGRRKRSRSNNVCLFFPDDDALVTEGNWRRRRENTWWFFFERGEKDGQELIASDRCAETSSSHVFPFFLRKTDGRLSLFCEKREDISWHAEQF